MKKSHHLPLMILTGFHKEIVESFSIIPIPTTSHSISSSPKKIYTGGILLLFQSNSFFEEEEISQISYGDFHWSGAQSPSPDILPQDIPSLLMHALEYNHIPYKDAGLHTVWEFAGDTTRHVFQHNITEFIESAHETANTMSTSFYGAAMNGQKWEMETELNRVGGDNGWIATQVMRTVCSDGRVRRWQFELRKNRRPPNLNAWYVESIGSSDRKGNFEPE